MFFFLVFFLVCLFRISPFELWSNSDIMQYGNHFYVRCLFTWVGVHILVIFPRHIYNHHGHAVSCLRQEMVCLCRHSNAFSLPPLPPPSGYYHLLFAGLAGVHRALSWYLPGVQGFQNGSVCTSNEWIYSTVCKRGGLCMYLCVCLSIVLSVCACEC